MCSFGSENGDHFRSYRFVYLTDEFMNYWFDSFSSLEVLPPSKCRCIYSASVIRNLCPLPFSKLIQIRAKLDVTLGVYSSRRSGGHTVWLKTYGHGLLWWLNECGLSVTDTVHVCYSVRDYLQEVCCPLQVIFSRCCVVVQHINLHLRSHVSPWDLLKTVMQLLFNIPLICS